MPNEQGTDTDEGRNFYTVRKTSYYAKSIASSSRKDDAKLKIWKYLVLFIYEKACPKLLGTYQNLKSVCKWPLCVIHIGILWFLTICWLCVQSRVHLDASRFSSTSSLTCICSPARSKSHTWIDRWVSRAFGKWLHYYPHVLLKSFRVFPTSLFLFCLLFLVFNLKSPYVS